MKQFLFTAFVIVLLIVPVGTLQAQQQGPDSWAFNAVNDFRIFPNITYSVGNGYECKLDVYARNNITTPCPTLLFIHGGGWVVGSKEGTAMNLLPYFEMGFCVVNVEYRLARVSLAPAAVEDCRLALRWIFKNAKQYGFDTTRIVVSGGSAGGHLALMTGMVDASDGFDMPTDWDYASVQPKVAAIVNWYGITDVKELLSGPNKQNYAVYWIGDQPNREAIARRVSPLSYIRQDLPPIFTVHGDKDNLVPYTQAVRLHDALSKAGVPNEFMTIPDGRHGGFAKAEMARVYSAIKAFLKKNKVID
jgi:acetyl esterase/lipase